MKNLRKLLAVIITVAMMATMFVIPAFAAETSDADICDTLGMLKGTDGTVSDAYLATTPLRYQAAIMFLRLKGLEEEALAYKGTDNFDDAGEIWSDGQKMLAYLKANPELGFEGIGDNKFDPMGEMTAQAYYKVLLVALGYEYDVDFKWDEVFAFAKEIGLSKVADVKEFTVNDLAIATVEALNTNVRDEEYTLIEFLVAEGVVSEAAAIKAGLIEPEPEVLAVESVSADNLKQIYVEFNGADFDEDDVTDIDNYKLTGTDDKDLDKIASADLDGNVVTLTLEGSVGNQKKAKLTVKKKILGEDQKFEFEFIDTTLPKALSAEVVGISTVKIVFSEPIDRTKLKKESFEIDGGDYYIKDAEAVNNDTEVNVTVYSAFDEGELEVKIKDNNIVDYAGFSVLKKTFKLDVVKDEEAPVVVGYKNAKPGSITLIFNEDIEIVNYDEENYYHTNTKNEVDLGSVTDSSVDGRELKLSFDTNRLPEGRAYVYIAKNSVRDLWENKNDKIMVEVEVVVDNTPPEIKKLEVKTQRQIKITFDEVVTKKTAEDEDNYTILNSKGEKVKDIIYNITRDPSDFDKVTVDFNEDLSGKYTLVIDGVEDDYGNAAKITKEFTVDDMVDPDFADFKVTLYNSGEKGQMLKIDFGERMTTDKDNKYSVADIEKYEILDSAEAKLKALADLDVDPEITVVNDGKSIEIKVASKKDKDKGYDLDDTMKIRIGRVADAAGNYTKEYSGIRPIVEADEVEIGKVEAVAKDEVKITFKDYFSKFYGEDIVLTTNKNSDALAIANKLNGKINTGIDKDGNTVVTFKIHKDDELNPDATSGNSNDPVYLYVVGNKSENKYGMKLKLDDKKKVDDKIAPTIYSDKESEYLVDTNADDHKFELVFTEALVVKDDVYEYADAVFEVKAGTKVLEYKKDYTVSAGSTPDQLTFTLVQGGYFKADTDKTFTIQVKVVKDGQIKDAAGNALKDVDVSVKVKFKGTP